RAWLRTTWSNPWRFKSSLAHDVHFHQTQRQPVEVVERASSTFDLSRPQKVRGTFCEKYDHKLLTSKKTALCRFFAGTTCKSSELVESSKRGLNGALFWRPNT